MMLAAGLAAQGQVVHALILRETRTRFGRNQLGYLWAFIEPLLWIATFLAMFAIAGREPPLGISSIAFFATGLVPFNLFRESVTRGMSAVGANKALLFYPKVRPLDLVLARSLLEFVTLTFVLATILFFDVVAFGSAAPDDPLLMLLAIGGLSALGGGLGLLAGSAATYWPSVERLVGPLLRPLFWVSGIFFSVETLPGAAREILLWNPVLHAIELVRAGQSHTCGRYADPAYVAVWIVCLALVGLTVERMARRRLEVV